MAKTYAEVEVQKTTMTNGSTGKNTAPVHGERLSRSYAQQYSQPGGWGWMLAPLALLAAGCCVFLVARRWWLNSCYDDERQM